MDRRPHSRARFLRGAASCCFSALALLGIAACGDDASEMPPPGPAPINILELPGNYVATTFTITTDTEADVLGAGGELSLTLGSDFSTQGRLLVPAGTAGAEETLDVSLEGEWNFSAVARLVTLEIAGAPPFLDAIALEPARAAGTIELSGEVMAAEGTVRVVLRLQ